MTTQLKYSYAQGPTDADLIEDTIPANLAKIAARYPDNLALVDVHANRQWSYQQFYRDVRNLATGLHRAGVITGERVGIWALNRWEWTMVQYATAELGAIMVNINPAYRQHELNYVLEQAGITTIIASEEVPTANYPRMIQRAQEELGSLDRIIIMNSESWDQVFDVDADDAALDALQATMTNTDAVNIQYTSGTTGFPKGATLSHRNILNNGFFVGEINRYTDQDRICIPVPYYHCFGMVMGNLAATTHGAAMIIPAPSFNPEKTLVAVEQHRCTALYGVPTMFIAELALENLDEFDLSSLRTGIMAGSPCPDEVMRKVISTMNMDEVTICYGMTETSPVSMQTRPDDDLQLRVSTVGRPSPHAEIKIIDPETGETLPVNTAGELCTKGYLVMMGYWNQQDKTDEVLGADGWMRTGDIAQMDENGYVQVTGRMKDMVIRGGENIYPREIEEFLYTHPDILDAQVVGVPDDRYGEELMAWIQLRQGASRLTAQDLRDFAIGALAKFKIPRYVHIVEEFPTTVTGKVRKVAMRETSVELLRKGGVIDDGRAGRHVVQRQ
ncbi:MAG TPA: AMP-binding protein [Candidatus Yaniella excrementigallinarum]|nr:AMP-binding protein [Candidatus Yaniella excrementigallinarum]